MPLNPERSNCTSRIFHICLQIHVH